MKGVFLLICTLLIPFSQSFAMGEDPGSKKLKLMASDAYVKMAKASFDQLILDYNKNREGVDTISNSLKNPEDKKALRKYLVKNKIKSLPPIKRIGDKAFMAIGLDVIVFSILSIRKGELYYNDKLVKFDGSSLANKEKSFSKILRKKKRFSFLSLIISESYAAGVSAELDTLLMASVMKITKDLEDRGLCALCGDENDEQMKTNFNKMISKMSSMADQCESQGYMGYTDESEVGRFAHSLNEIQEYKPNIADDYELKNIIEDKFKALDSDEQKRNLTCGQLAYMANKEEVAEKFPELSNRNRNVFAAYLGSTSAGVEENKDGLSRYLGSKCEAHSRLLNCLATNSDYGRGVYNRSAGRDEYKKVRIGTDLNEGYQHHGITNTK